MSKHGRLAFAALLALPLTLAAAGGALACAVDGSAEFRSFTAWNAAVKAAGLEATLSGLGQFTQFAPTDEAFSALPPGRLEFLMRPENRSELQALVERHIVPGRIMVGDLAGRHELLASVNGAGLLLDGSSDEVLVNDAEVLRADIETRHGVLHAIDSVMLPE